MSFRRVGLRVAAMAATVLAVSTCETVTNVELLEVDASGFLFGLVYVDENNNEALDAGDTPLTDVTVVLSSGRGVVVEEVQTDTLGAFTILDVEVGTYRLGLDGVSVGDSLRLYAPDGEEITVSRGDTTRVDFGTSFPVLTVEEVLAAEAGRRVVTSGIALNQRLPFGDGRVHIQGPTRALRAIDVARTPLNPGDSVRFQGRTAVDEGRTVLEDVTPVVLVGQAVLPMPQEVTTAEAASANAGSLDAALLRVRSADIVDTATVDGDFVTTIDDGTGPLDLVFQSFLQVSPAQFPPDSIFRIDEATGLLVPSIDINGATRWRLLPRGGADVTLTLKTVDVGITMAVDDGVGIAGDEFNFTVAVRNDGGRPATGVEVVDSLPAGLALISTSTTRGSYSSATGTWTVGDLGSTDADTLRIKARLTTGVLGSILNQARVKPLVNEVDVNGANDVAFAAVTAVSQIAADVSVEVTASLSSIVSGDTLDLTILTINNGPFRATSVQIADTLPAGLTLVGSTPSTGSYDPATGIWALDTLKAGTSEQLRLQAVVGVSMDTQVENRVWLRPLMNEVDTVQANDSSAVTIELRAAASPSPQPLSWIQATGPTRGEDGAVLPPTGKPGDPRPIARSGIVPAAVSIGHSVVTIEAGTPWARRARGAWTLVSLGTGSG